MGGMGGMMGCMMAGYGSHDEGGRMGGGRRLMAA